jgi:hypothetical protein
MGVAQSKLLMQTRLLFPAFPAFALLAALAYERLSAFDLQQFSLQRFTRLVMLLVFGLTALGYAIGFASGGTFAYLVGVESREAYLARHLGAYGAALRFINTELPRDARIVFLWEPRSYYAARATQPDAILDAWAHLRWQYHDAATIAGEWRARGYTHVLLHRAGIGLHSAIGLRPHFARRCARAGRTVSARRSGVRQDAVANRHARGQARGVERGGGGVRDLSFGYNAMKTRIGILLLAFALRVAFLAQRPLWYDEAFSVLLAERDFASIVRGTAVDVQPPLYYVLLHAWLGLNRWGESLFAPTDWGENVFGLRLLSVALSLLVVALVYALARRWFSERVAVWAMLFTALAPFQIYHAQELRMYALFALGALLYAYAIPLPSCLRLIAIADSICSNCQLYTNRKSQIANRKSSIGPPSAR